MKQYRKETKLESIVYQVIITLALIALPVFGHAATTEQALPAEVTETAGDGDGFDWNKLIDAIAHFESKGNARAVNGQYVGLLQISPVLVRECNNILKARGESKRYTLKDRYNAESRTTTRPTPSSAPSESGKVASDTASAKHKTTSTACLSAWDCRPPLVLR